MAWKESDRVSLRSEFVRLASAEGANVSELCRRFGIARKTGYKWLKRWREQGESGLEDRSRRPTNSPARTDVRLERQVIALRKKHPAWGGRKIRERLFNTGMKSPPSASTITAILHRHGLIDPAASAEKRAYSSFVRAEPNELWQVDFKGEFALTRGSFCYPLTILDDHSRFSLGIIACGNQKRRTVQSHFRNVFHLYGLPRAIYVDNGNPWGTKDQGCGHTRFTAWLLRHDVQVIHGRPYYPQGRGKVERFHRTLKLEVLQGRHFSSLKETQQQFDRWRTIYNEERPHDSLDLEVPLSHYRASDRTFQEQTRPYEYSDRFEVRKTSRHGQLRFHGVTYRVSEAFSNDLVGLAPTRKEGVWDVHYCRYRIAKLNEREGTIERLQPQD